MAVNTEIRKRLKFEISFRDLTLTLKGKGKHLLRGVNGKIMPGRITAVMGPSRAGKTTFHLLTCRKPCTLSLSLYVFFFFFFFHTLTLHIQYEFFFFFFLPHYSNTSAANIPKLVVRYCIILFYLT